ncbi:MAG: peptide MFS transporter, partial [Gemmataceae bacterium]
MSSAAPQRTFLGHPLGLYVLFFTEMWERFSYYGMRALLILYMTQYFRWAQKDASTVYKVYTSFVYVTPILGGFLADRYLGNRWAVIIGAVLMAIGHFLMAFEEFEIFMAALIFLILGNGFFKPNMSTQVGRLYPANDGRRDAAYTIFYMGINLGAFLSPIACGWLKDNTVGGFHSGFTLAGIGMVIGLVIYLAGQPLIQEIDPDTGATPLPKAADAAPAEDRPLSEAEAAVTPSVLGSLSNAVPMLLYVLTAALIVYAPIYYLLKPAADRPSAFWDALMIAIAGGCLGLIAFICGQVRNALRDRVLAILILGVFVMFFWGAFEQAGNVLNLWAENNTNRYLWKPMGELDAVPEVHEAAAAADGGEPVKLTTWQRFSTMFTLKPNKDEKVKTWGEYFEGFFNPISTESFQSINALAIFVIAPVFAALWVWLDKRGMQPSIALKMFFGLVFMMLSVVVMIESSRQEDRPTTQAYDGTPPGL